MKCANLFYYAELLDTTIKFVSNVFINFVHKLKIEKDILYLSQSQIAKTQKPIRYCIGLNFKTTALPVRRQTFLIVNPIRRVEKSANSWLEQ